MKISPILLSSPLPLLHLWVFVLVLFMVPNCIIQSSCINYTLFVQSVPVFSWKLTLFPLSFPFSQLPFSVSFLGPLSFFFCFVCFCFCFPPFLICSLLCSHLPSVYQENWKRATWICFLPAAFQHQWQCLCVPFLAFPEFPSSGDSPCLCLSFCSQNFPTFSASPFSLFIQLLVSPLSTIFLTDF